MRFLLLLVLIVSCGDKQDLKFTKIERKDFDQVINNSRTPAKPDLAQVKTILNRDYPIEIALFEDGKWYYDLPNLDDGFGTWEYKDGKIELFAERDLFDMEIEVLGLEERAKVMGIRFRDRFGIQTMKVEKINATK